MTPGNVTTLRLLRRIALAGTGLLGVLLVVLSVLAATQSSHSADTAVVPAPLATGTALQAPRRVPTTRLIDEQGKAMPVSAWRGKWVVLAPSMTLCHEVCPVTTAALEQVTSELRELGLANQVVVAEVTVDPWRDTPARLRAYRRLTGANFALLTGTPGQIRRFWAFFGVRYRRVAQRGPPDIDWLTHKPEAFAVQHTDGLFFLDPAGQERIADEGMPDVDGRLSATLRGLLDEEGRQELAHPQLPWTGGEVIDDLYWLMDKNVPASSVQKVNAPSVSEAERVLAGSPVPLAALHAQASELLGSQTALAARLRSLRGYPVVINAWASWCPPCRSEFSIFAAASARYGREVAFLGIDTNDSARDARSFLSEHPVSYPSYRSSSSQLGSIAVIEGLPTTIFIDRAGHVVNVHPGQYDTETTLENDLDRYLTGS